MKAVARQSMGIGWKSRAFSRLLTRDVPTQAVGTIVDDVAKDGTEKHHFQQHRAIIRRDKKMNVTSQPSVFSKESTIPEAKQPFRKQIKRKWWAKMDRASFFKLLTAQMSSNKVSAVLRKYFDEFPILNSDWNWSDQELVMIVCALMKMNRSEIALEVLQNQIRNLDLDILNRISAASARLGNAQVAEGVLEIVKYFKMQPNVVTFTSVIHACARGARIDIPMALDYFEDMISAGVEPNARTYGAVILAYARLGCWTDVQELVNSISYRDDAHKMVVFTCAIISCSRNRQHCYASRLFELLLEDGVFPGHNVCNAALSCYARTSDLTKLRRTFELIERYATPTTYSFNCLISAFGNASQMDEALNVFKKMQDDDAVTPDIVTFNSLLCGAVRSRKVDMFPYILSLMDDAGVMWDPYTLTILLQGCALEGDTKMAEVYWSEATDSDQSSAINHRVTLDRSHFETLMNTYFMAKDYKAVVELWTKNKVCRRRAKSSKALNFLIRACEGLKDDKMAMKILAEFAERGQPLSIITHNHMLEVFLAANKFAEALAYLHEMIDEHSVSTFSFTALLKYLAKHDRHADVLAVFKLFLETQNDASKRHNSLLHYPTDAIYVLTMRSAVKLKDHEAVLSIYRDLPTTMSAAVRTQLLVLAISSCEREGDWSAAVTMYDEMTGRIHGDINVELYKQIVRIVASAGECDRALDVGGGQWYRENRAT
ncbi:hypothetical protein PsorP6_004748 [Peronosclerospora sorghi]|uniref:Uncharacterized protein n=1 Tax=Peronosclerospora sorghi TaxID=230839 RepID=A0ACC0VPG3_9STRA|nr:hypothetical protein PsorP6_004748 [Peronosclerospora sorghi]